MTIQALRRRVYSYYRKRGRDLPWRKTRDPYRIAVSEIMLQQTQVSRVLLKYPLFIRHFPTIQSLARAPLAQVLAVWQGLGYNRRALLLHRFAKQVVSVYNGKSPREIQALRQLPGVGGATAGAICAFAFNQPSVYIETNIRSVFIHAFFKNRANISDAQLMPYIAKALDRKNPRKWYSALMDYGVYLKEIAGNPSRRSLHYVRQSPFEGSNRQIRGRILKIILQKKRIQERALSARLGCDTARLRPIVEALQSEGLILKSGAWVGIGETRSFRKIV